ncbi:MAG: hypothetical protein Hyperionvirus1_136 [Hyperionvirus sp.]|uniref:Uncharacterized protein n=1 Tax=Hyperionvirus sp. TaxID=2487770 RepID=A0A3G5A5P9_9VIRU|nr:MAG: hypothetical protein Hyperionvirus1_136 [Hyperionvirus sp.]
MTKQLVGFQLLNIEYGIVPVYNKQCDQHLTLSSVRCTKVLRDLTLLRQTPDEIKQIPETEISRMRSLLKVTLSWTPAAETKCSCPTEPKSMIPKKPHTYWFRNCRGRQAFTSLINRVSWSCPFCCEIMWSIKDFIFHIRQSHPNKSNKLIVVDHSLLGGSWCPLCETVVRKATIPPGTVDWRETITPQQLSDLIDQKWFHGGKGIEEYLINNAVCSRCTQWIMEKKRLEIPASLNKKLQKTINKMQLSPLDVWVPPNVTFYVSELGLIGDYDEDSQFFVDLLKHNMLEEIPDSFLREYYSSSVWDRVLYTAKFGSKDRRLRTPEEVKATPLPGAKVLAKIREEINLLEVILTETGILPPLRNIIRTYLPWQLWNLERLMSCIHTDVTQYGPSLAIFLARLDILLDNTLILF